MLGPFTVDTIFPGFPAVQREFTVDAVATQQIVSVYLFTFALMSLLHGPLSDALGRRPVSQDPTIIIVTTGTNNQPKSPGPRWR